MKAHKIIYTSILFIISIPIFAQVNISEEIEIEELKLHMNYLASDELEGRLPGTEGGKKAAEYIREQLKSLNVNLLGENGFQFFDITKGIEPGENNYLKLETGDAEFGKDYMPLAFSGNGEISTSAVFLGYGFNFKDDSLSWNDYELVDVKNKWAVVLRGAPDVSHNSKYSSQSSLRKKILRAKDAGASGIIFVSGEKFDESDELFDLDYAKREPGIDFPAIQIKRSIADNLLKKFDVSVSILESQLNENLMPNSFEIDETISAKINLIKVYAKTENVIALLEGTDPILKNEYIVLGAHFDHLGYGGQGSGSRRPDTSAIHNGADDNASGTSAIIEIFENLAVNKNKLKRSIIFSAFGAEEMGLLGSKYFVDNPPVDLKKIKFMLNLDMVGRMKEGKNEFSASGTGTGIGIPEMIDIYAEEMAVTIAKSSEGYGPSDHASFYANDIPVMFLYTAMHEDYHTPSDKSDLINFKGQKSVSDFAYKIIFDIANREKNLVFQEAGPKERQTGARSYKVTLGIMPDVAGVVENGLRADAVIPGRPAAIAGMQKGDIIIGMEGKPVKDIYEYMNRLSDFKVGQRISVEVQRGDEKLILIVEL
ncbi:MAG: M20/M25/M40 family metallo-hydrolase [Bacteroidetes bacterium]|nr:M20/M25/M40 family metallo-hydrolase [Bacteroidota bacterium]